MRPSDWIVYDDYLSDHKSGIYYEVKPSQTVLWTNKGELEYAIRDDATHGKVRKLPLITSLTEQERPVYYLIMESDTLSLSRIQLSIGSGWDELEQLLESLISKGWIQQNPDETYQIYQKWTITYF